MVRFHPLHLYGDWQLCSLTDVPYSWRPLHSYSDFYLATAPASWGIHHLFLWPASRRCTLSYPHILQGGFPIFLHHFAASSHLFPSTLWSFHSVLLLSATSYSYSLPLFFLFQEEWNKRFLLHSLFFYSISKKVSLSNKFWKTYYFFVRPPSTYDWPTHWGINLLAQPPLGHFRENTGYASL